MAKRPVMERKEGKSMIENSIVKLMQYGLATGLISREDRRYMVNHILELLKIDAISDEALAQVMAFDGEDKSVVDQLEDIFAEHVCDKCAAPGVCAQETLHIERPNGVFDWGGTDVERRAEFTLRYFFSRAQFAGDYAAAENIRDLVADRQ